nr:hypothetical protein [Tanacetum cinerariifolium]
MPFIADPKSPVGDHLDGLLVDSASGKTVATVEGHLDYSFASAWHPDGKIFATGNQDKTCRVWENTYIFGTSFESSTRIFESLCYLLINWNWNITFAVWSMVLMLRGLDCMPPRFEDVVEFLIPSSEGDVWFVRTS